jgi:hypothetical protein
MVDGVEGGGIQTVPPIQEPTNASKPIASGLAFSGLAQVRNMEAQLRWIGFQAALGFNFVGWGGVAVWLFNFPSLAELCIITGACVGAVYANFLHFKILGRDGKFLGLWNEKLIELEEVNGIDGGVSIFSSKRYRELKSRTPTVQHILRRSVVLCGLVWVAFTLWTAVRIL